MKKNFAIIAVSFTVILLCLHFQINLVHAEEQKVDLVNYTDARIFNNNGVDFVSQHKYEEAAKEFQKALEIDPGFHAARYNLALAHYNMGKVDEAISEFVHLTNSSYYFVNAHYNLGTIYLREGMLDEAMERLKIVIELEPNHAEAHFNLGYIYFKKDLLDKAIEEYKKGLEFKPQTLKGHLSLALIYEKKNMYKDAIDEYSKVLEIEPGNKDAKQELNSLKAIVQIKEELNVTPDDVESYIHLGHIYYSRGMYQEASNNYNRALQIDPQNELAKTSAQKAIVQLFASEDAKAKNTPKAAIK